jgi:hypothetical protein
MRRAIDRRVGDRERHFRVIPVLLPGAKREERSRYPSFLTSTTWVEFRESLDEQDAWHRLICGIRSVEPGPGPGDMLRPGECPYYRLEPFDVKNSTFFFRRETLS